MIFPESVLAEDPLHGAGKDVESPSLEGLNRHRDEVLRDMGLVPVLDYSWT